MPCEDLTTCYLSVQRNIPQTDACCRTALVRLKKKKSLVSQSCHEQVDAVLLLFSFTDRTSFDDLPNQITKWTEKSGRNAVKLVVGTKYPSVRLTVGEAGKKKKNLTLF